MKAADWIQALEADGYLISHSLATMISLAVRMRRPLLVEGPAGVGKTELAHKLASVLGRELVRLQCFEGMDASHALYDWNYHKQLADITRSDATNIFTEAYILPRPLMRALQSEPGAVLLIDEVDRADEAFEALLLEFLGEFQISVPEWKTVSAEIPPVVVLTSNRTRALSDALRRRCLYAHVGWPEVELEERIVHLHVPDASKDAVTTIVNAIRMLRTWDLMKPPGVAETIDWARAYVLSGHEWTVAFIDSTLGCVIKDAMDLETVLGRIQALVKPDT